MTRFVVGYDRGQSTLFPERLDDYLGEDNPVRAIDVFVDELDLAKLGFGGVEPEATGRPAYHPATLLKDLRLRIPQSGAVESASGAGVPAQHRIGVADRPPDAGLQDDSRFPQGQRRGHTQGLPCGCGFVPTP